MYDIELVFGIIILKCFDANQVRCGTYARTIFKTFVNNFHLSIVFVSPPLVMSRIERRLRQWTFFSVSTIKKSYSLNVWFDKGQSDELTKIYNLYRFTVICSLEAIPGTVSRIIPNDIYTQGEEFTSQVLLFAYGKKARLPKDLIILGNTGPEPFLFYLRRNWRKRVATIA